MSAATQQDDECAVVSRRTALARGAVAGTLLTALGALLWLTGAFRLIEGRPVLFPAQGFVYALKPVPADFILLAGAGLLLMAVWKRWRIPEGRFHESWWLLGLVAVAISFVLMPLAYSAGIVLPVALAGAMIVLGAVKAVRSLSEGRAVPEWAAPAALSAMAGAGLVVISLTIYDGLPFVVDSVCQWTHAHLLAEGRLRLPPPLFPEHFESHAMVIMENGWFSQYPPGHIFLMVPFVLAGVPWLLNPLAGAASLWLTFVLGRHLWGARTGLVGAALLAISPFFLVMQSGMMNHGTSMLLLLLATLLCVRADGTSGWWPWVAAGFCVALSGIARPLTAAGIALPLAVLVVHRIMKGEVRWWPSIPAGVLGAVPPVLALLWFNWGTTGSPFELGYKYSNVMHVRVGFDEEHSLVRGMFQSINNYYVLSMWLLGLPASSYVLAAAHGLFGRWRRGDWYCLACLLSLGAIYMTYSFQDQWYGPRFLYEALPYLMLLTARGLLLAAEAMRRVVPEAARLAVPVALSVMVVGFAAMEATTRVHEVRRYQRLEHRPVHEFLTSPHARADAIYFVPMAGRQPSVRFGPLTMHNMRHYPGGTLFVRDLGTESNRRLVQAFPRAAYYRLGFRLQPTPYDPFAE